MAENFFYVKAYSPHFFSTPPHSTPLFFVKIISSSIMKVGGNKWIHIFYSGDLHVLTVSISMEKTALQNCGTSSTCMILSYACRKGTRLMSKYHKATYDILTSQPCVQISLIFYLPTATSTDISVTKSCGCKMKLSCDQADL